MLGRVIADSARNGTKWQRNLEVERQTKRGENHICANEIEIYFNSVSHNWEALILRIYVMEAIAHYFNYIGIQ